MLGSIEVKMMKKLIKDIISIILIVEGFSLLIAYDQFLTWATQLMNLAVITSLLILMIILHFVKDDQKRVIIGNSYLTLFYIVLIGIITYAFLQLKPLLNSPYTDPTFILILLIIIDLIAIYAIFIMWFKYYKKYKR